MYWIAEAPIAAVNAALAMIPRLEAEESLLTSARVALGSGSLKPDAARSLQRGWTNDIRAGLPRQVTTRPQPHELAAMGIGFHRIVRPPSAAAAAPEATP